MTHDCGESNAVLGSARQRQSWWSRALPRFQASRHWGAAIYDPPLASPVGIMWEGTSGR